jgi:hypothetical protein
MRLQIFVQCKETFSGVQLRDVRSERGLASRLFEKKCFLTLFFISIFSSFGLPELNRTALANAATVSGHCTNIPALSATLKHFFEFWLARAELHSSCKRSDYF